MKLLILMLVFSQWSLAFSAPLNNTMPHKKFVHPKKAKENFTKKMEGQNIIKQGNAIYTISGAVTSTESSSESSTTLPSSTSVTLDADQQYAKSGSNVSSEGIENTTLTIPPSIPEAEGPNDDENPIPDEVSSVNEESLETSPGLPMTADTEDGTIEYNLGNPLALKLHLPWWPLKDMLKGIQDAISLMNLTMHGNGLKADITKTKIVNLDGRNYTLKVKVFKPHENNRLLVRLISLTPVIEKGRIPAEEGVEADENERNTDQDGSQFPQVKEIEREEDQEEGIKKDDDDSEKEEKSKPKYSKKEKQEKYRKKEMEMSDSEEDSE